MSLLCFISHYYQSSPQCYFMPLSMYLFPTAISLSMCTKNTQNLRIRYKYYQSCSPSAHTKMRQCSTPKHSPNRFPNSFKNGCMVMNDNLNTQTYIAHIYNEAWTIFNHTYTCIQTSCIIALLFISATTAMYNLISYLHLHLSLPHRQLSAFVNPISQIWQTQTYLSK